MNRLVRYFLVGGFAAVLNLAVFTLLVRGADMPLYAAATVSFVIATFANYAISVRVVFESGARFSKNTEIALIYVVSAVGLAVNQAVLYLLVGCFRQGAEFSQVVALGTIFLWNYGIRRYFVFKAPGQAVLPMPERLAAIAAATQAWFSRLYPYRWTVGLAAALIAGTVFRLAWLTDVEFKGDETWTYLHVEAFWRHGVLPRIGMASSAKLANPGMSIWTFIGLSAFLPHLDPLSLTRAVQLLNVVALLLLAYFASQVVERKDREPWLWSVALTAVNVFAVLFSRKIWAQDVLPIFVAIMLIGWWRRERFWGAFAWGLAGILTGQVHLSGFFFAAAFFVATARFARKSANWPGWIAGSLAGSVFMLPWLTTLTQGHNTTTGSHGLLIRTMAHMIQFVAKWFNMAGGFDLTYALGDDYVPFLRYPGHTYLAAAALIAVVICSLAVFVRFGIRLAKAPAEIKAFFAPAGSNTALSLFAGFPAYLVLIALNPANINQHYIIVAFALPALSVAWLDRASRGAAGGNSRRLLTVLVSAEALVTVLFLSFIHLQPTIHGDYGTPYRAQPVHAAPPAPAKQAAVSGQG